MSNFHFTELPTPATYEKIALALRDNCGNPLAIGYITNGIGTIEKCSTQYGDSILLSLFEKQMPTVKWEIPG